MSVSWSDALGQHPAKQAASVVRSATGLPAGTTPTRGSTNAPTARASGAGSQSTGLLYSPSSPRVHAPLATVHVAHRAAASSSLPNIFITQVMQTYGTWNSFCATLKIEILTKLRVLLAGTMIFELAVKNDTESNYFY